MEPPDFKSTQEFVTSGSPAFGCQVVAALLHLTRLNSRPSHDTCLVGPLPHAPAISRCQSLESCRPSLSGAALRRVAAFVQRTGVRFQQPMSFY